MRSRTWLRFTAFLAGVTAVGAAARPGTEPPVPSPTLSSAAAVVTGRVVFAGKAPEAAPVDMSAEPYCTEAHGGRAPAHREVDADASGGLRDVVVYIKEGAARAGAAPAEVVMLDQKGCMYQPRVVALQVGQTLVVRNSDALLHNVRVKPAKNPGFNLGQPMAGIQAKRTFRAAEVGIGVRCDIHEWMTASIAVFDHPFFAVSAADGQFTLPALPPGDYVLEAWHRTLGTRTQRVQVGAGGLANLTIRFE